MIGFDLPLSDLVQFGRLDLNQVPNTLPHSISLLNIPAPSTFVRPADLSQHGTSQTPTPSLNVRNRVVTQVAQPMMNPVTPHSLVQHAVNTIGTQHSSSSQVVIPQTRVSVQQPVVTVNQPVVIVP